MDEDRFAVLDQKIGCLMLQMIKMVVISGKGDMDSHVGFSLANREVYDKMDKDLEKAKKEVDVMLAAECKEQGSEYTSIWN